MTSARPVTPSTDLPLTLLTLGGASLVSPATSEPERLLLGPGKPLALLAYLACAPRRTALRDHLVDLLWADVDPEKGRHALRQTIWYIKRQVGESLLATSDGRIELALSIPCDRDRLLAAVEAGDPDGVIAAYRGEFLPNFSVPGGSEFERWADIERLRLRAHFLRAVEELAHQHLSSARFKEAITLARRARDEFPLDERPWRLLFEALAASGDQLRFNAEVEAFERMLAEDEREPDAATRARMVWPGTTGPTSPSNDSEPSAGLAPELTGRQHEFNRILRAWDSARLGPSRHLHLSAPAGLGKTRLLLETQRRIRAAGGRTAYVRSNPGGRALACAYAGDLAHALAAFPGAKGVADATAAVLVALDPALSSIYRSAPDPSTGDEAIRRRILALTDLVGAIADEGPVALFLDDLHWADSCSRQVVTGMLERVDSARILIVTAARPLPEVATLRQAGTTIDLIPLVPSQLIELMASIGPMPATGWAESFGQRLWDASGGSPLLALEALQLALDEAVLRLDQEGWWCDALARLAEAFPEGGALRRRVELLPRLERWLLLLLAAEGGPIQAEDLVALSGHPREQAEAALGALEHRGLVHRAADLVEPAHDEFARLATELAEAGALAAAHRALAHRVNGGDLRHRAYHLRAADDFDGLMPLFRQWTQERRARGDRRPSHELAADLLGPDAGPADVAQLVSSLPWHHRAWGSRRARMTAAGLVVLGAISAWRVVRPEIAPATGPELVSIVVRNDRKAVGVVPLGASPQSAVLDVVTLRPSADTQWFTLPNAMLSGPPRSTVEGWTSLQLDYPDGGGVDVAVVSPDGRFRRLTTGPQDDNAGEWSPDGRLIIGTTGANSPPGTTDYDIYAAEPRSGRIRYLTTGRAHDQGPMVSPDGTRLAFVRMSLDTLGDKQFCIAWFDGTEPRCRGVDGGEALGTTGWIDRDRVATTSLTPGGQEIGILDARTLAYTPIRPTAGGSALLSPDRKWILCHCRPEQGNAWQMMEVADPEHLVEVRSGGSAYPAMLIWAARAGSDTAWVETLRLHGPTVIAPGETGRYEAEALTARGGPMGGVVIRWSSRDTTVVAVDPGTGVVRGRGRGSTWLVASAGGWRTDSVAVTVQGSGTGPALSTERWAPGWEERWRRGGDPWPKLVSFEGRPVLHLNGDGSYLSGVERWPGWRGPSFGAEFAVRLRVTRANWQRFTVGVDLGLDTLQATRWDRRAGTAPRSADGVCAASFGGESRYWMSHLGLEAGRETGTPEVDPALGDGTAWHRVRVQVFPDGGCGIAIDGRPVWISTAKLVRRGPPIVFAYGMSYQTDLLVQEIETWEGIRGGIDWTRAPTTAELRDGVR